MAIVMVSKEVVMGIKDWFKKKPESVEQAKEPEIELPELDRDALFEETRNLLDEEEVQLVPEEIVETTPEYDSGDVDVSALLEDDMESNYNLNTVENFEVEDMLSGAKIVGDLPEEVDFE
tara:strand:+ start:153 stop:512 length:360 start_codon:yes stop_codon:yes gene_type:complete